MILSKTRNGHMPKFLMCILAFCMCLLLLIPGGLIEGVSAEVIKAPLLAIGGKVETLPTIDGELKEEFWNNATWHDVANRQVASMLSNNCNFAVAWDNDNLYVAVKVVDAEIVTENIHESINNNDGIEILIDPKNAKLLGKFDVKSLRLMYQVVDGAYQIWGGVTPQKNLSAKYPDVKAAHAMTDDGYIVEALFPFADLGIENPKDGLIMGFEVTNNDDDAAETKAASDRNTLYWNEETKLDSPATWGNLCLYNKAKPVVSYKGTPKVDGVISADEGWVFTSEAPGNDRLSYTLASMCDDKNLYLAIDLKGTDLANSGMTLLLDSDDCKDSVAGHLMQVVHYSFQKNTANEGASLITSASVGGDDGYILELYIPLDKLGYKPEYLDTVGMEIEMFSVHENYDNSNPRVMWSNATTDSVWSYSTSYGTIILNNPNVAGGNNVAPTGNQISSYSIAEGTKLSGKITVTDPNGDPLTFTLDPNSKNPGERSGTFELNETTGEWTYTPPKDIVIVDTILNYYILADDGHGGTFHQRIEIRIEHKPTFKTYHVDGDTGKDTNKGLTPETAFRTLFGAVTRLRPGDTLIVHESEVPYGYTERAELQIKNSGLPEAYITIKAAEGERPVINTNGAWNTFKVAGSYIIIDGLTVTGIGDQMLPQMADNFRYYQQSLTGGGLHANVSTFNTNGISVNPLSGQGVSDVGIDRVKVTHHVVVRNCVIDYITGSGLGTSGSDYITFENNTITNCCWGDMYANSGIGTLGNIDIDDNFDAHKIVIRNNITAGNRHFVPWVHIKKFSDGNGIIVDSTDNAKTSKSRLEKGDKWGVQPYMGRYLIANNLSYFNGGSGIHAFDSANIDIVNNTIYQNGSTPALRNEYSDLFSNSSDDVRMYNNIVYSRSDGRENISGSSSSEVEYDYNLFFNSEVNNLGKNIAGKNGVAGTTAGENNLYDTDPLFVNVYDVDYDTGTPYPEDWEDFMVQYANDGGYFIGADYNVNILGFDFTLKEDSPAIGSGSKEWSDLLGNTDNRMGIFGTIGSPMRPIVASDAVPSTYLDLGEAPKTEPATYDDVKDNETDTDSNVGSDSDTADTDTTDVENPTDSANTVIFWIIGAVVAVGVIVGLIFGLKKSKAKKN